MAAARVLDLVLPPDPAEPAELRVRALILRADLAVRMDDPPLAARLLADADRIALTPAARAALGDDLRRAADLRDVLD